MGLVLAIEQHSGEEMKLYRQEIIESLSCVAADNYAMDRLVYLVLLGSSSLVVLWPRCPASCALLL